MTIPVVGTTSELRGDGVTMTALVGPGNGYDGRCIWWEQTSAVTMVSILSLLQVFWMKFLDDCLSINIIFFFKEINVIRPLCNLCGLHLQVNATVLCTSSRTKNTTDSVTFTLHQNAYETELRHKHTPLTHTVFRWKTKITSFLCDCLYLIAFHWNDGFLVFFYVHYDFMFQLMLLN